MNAKPNAQIQGREEKKMVKDDLEVGGISKYAFDVAPIYLCVNYSQ